MTPLYLADIANVEAFAVTFWDKVSITDDCWIWTASLTDKGYGNVNVPLVSGARSLLAHRISWLLTTGELPALFLCHRCDELYAVGDTSYRACVNPDHLFLGTNSDNIQDMYDKGRGRTYSARGEKHGLTYLTDEQVMTIRDRYVRGERQRSIAAAFDIPLQAVTRIVTRRTWAHLPGGALSFNETRTGERNGRSKLTEEDVRSLRHDLAHGLSTRKAAAKYGISKAAVNHVQRGKNWSHVI